MDKYFLAIIVLIIFSILAVLYVRIFTKIFGVSESDTKLSTNDDSANYDTVGSLSNLKPDSFTLLE